jgi:hypothetical protein
MNSLARCIMSFLLSDDGAGAAEYFVMFILLIGACLATIKTLGQVSDGQIWTAGIH